jgi:hypothetical protein
MKNDNIPSNKWTVEELKDYIRKSTKEANARIDSYKKLNLNDPVFDRVTEKLLRINPTKDDKLKLGFKGQKKRQLLMRAKRFEEFKRVDTITPEAIQAEKDKVWEMYASFTGDNGYDMSLKTYEELVDAFGVLGDDVIGTFDYMALVEQYSQAVDAGKEIDLVAIINRELNQHKGIDAKQRVDNIVEAIRIEAGLAKKGGEENGK